MQISDNFFNPRRYYTAEKVIDRDKNDCAYKKLFFSRITYYIILLYLLDFFYVLKYYIICVNVFGTDETMGSSHHCSYVLFYIEYMNRLPLNNIIIYNI